MAGAPATFKPSREQAAGARLPYARHIDDATIETRDGRLIQVLHLKGFPFETADTEELNYRKTVRETMLRGVANSRFALYHHIVRREVQPTMAGEVSGNGFAHALDAAWRARLGTRKLYVNDLFLTLVRRPLGGRVGVLEDIFRMARGASDSPGGRRNPGSGDERAERRARRPALGPGALRRAAADRLRRTAGRLLRAAGVLLAAVQRRAAAGAPAGRPTSAATCPIGGSASARGRSSSRPAGRAWSVPSRRWCR